jgi:hypothetical protein
VALRLPVAALGALLVCGCEIYAVPSAIVCPDVRQGTFDFAGDRVVLPTDCFFAQPGNAAYQIKDPIPFTGTISFIPGGNDTALCIEAPHAVPSLGTHDGLAIDVASVLGLSVAGCTCPSTAAVTAGKCSCPPDSPLSSCSCPAVIEQRIQGALQPTSGGFSGFTGVLINTVTPPPGTIPPDVCDCQKTCTYSYDLAATVAGTR